ncbi:MAG: SEC-C metal-binding domain-containing protein, partial [Phycisphaerae bacterium]
IVKRILSDDRECDEYNDNGSDTNEVASEPVELLRSQRVERNAPCPCGSGKIKEMLRPLTRVRRCGSSGI